MLSFFYFCVRLIFLRKFCVLLHVIGNNTCKKLAKQPEIMTPQLFRFELNLKTVLWGGDMIAAFKGITLDNHLVGESWEISGLKGHESVVASGDDAGLTLRQLIKKYRSQLVGKRIYRTHGTEFPLLIKFIDANKDLSVQVHPDEDLARSRHNCCGKTEMWYIIDAQPGASLLAGMSRTITPKEYLQHMADGTLLNVLTRHDTHAGDIFFLPAGRIHSIGAGNLLLEVQQPSDITYRVYDYNRLDINGKPRQLHTDLAIDAIDYTISRDCLRHYPDVKGDISLINSIFFNVGRVIVDGSCDVPMPHDAFLCLMCIGGKATINYGGNTTETIKQGESLLVPACVEHLSLNGSATIITATA